MSTGDRDLPDSFDAAFGRALRKSTVVVPCPSCARLQAELNAATTFIAREGFRRCDIAACNCGSWHGGNARDRLNEIYEALGEHVDMNGKLPIPVINEMASELAALRTRIESLRDPTVAMVVAGVDAFMPTASHNADEVHGDDIATVWRAMYDAAIDTAATQGGAK